MTTSSNTSCLLLSASILTGLAITSYSKPQGRASRQIDHADCSPPAVARLVNQAETHFRRGEFGESERLETAAAVCFESTTPRNARALAVSTARLAELSRILGRPKQATSLVRKALAIHESELRTDTPEYARALITLATLYADKGRFFDAEPLVRKAVEIHHQLSPTDPTGERAAMNTLGVLHAGLGDEAGAAQIFRRALANGKGEPPDEVTAALLHNLATIRFDRGDSAKAEILYRRALDIRRRILPKGHPDLEATIDAIAVVLKHAGKDKQARKLRGHN